jgi:hypothetical protein
MDSKPSTFDEEAYRKGQLGPVIRFGKTVSSKYSGWTQKQYVETQKETPEDGTELKTS